MNQQRIPPPTQSHATYDKKSTPPPQHTALFLASLLKRFMEVYGRLLRHEINRTTSAVRSRVLLPVFKPVQHLAGRSRSYTSWPASSALPQNPPTPRDPFSHKSPSPALSDRFSLPQNIRFRKKHSMATSDSSVPAAVNAAPPPHHDVKPLTGVEASKRLAAYKAVEDHFETSYSYIGIGSGSTVVYVVEAIAAKGRDVTSKMTFVPTGEQSKQLIIEAGLPLGSIDALPPVDAEQTKMEGVSALHVATGLQDLGLKGKRQSLDVAFDGADEIDEDLNCIKGGGACLFQEKLVATAAKKFVCVAGIFENL